MHMWTRILDWWVGAYQLILFGGPYYFLSLWVWPCHPWRFLYSLYDGIGGLSWNLGPNSSPDGPLAYMWRFLKTSRKIHQIKWFLIVCEQLKFAQQIRIIGIINPNFRLIAMIWYFIWFLLYTIYLYNSWYYTNVCE